MSEVTEEVSVRDSITATPVAPSRGALTPLGIDAVALTGGFLAERQALNHRTFLPHCGTWIDRMGWIDNFAIAATGNAATERQGKDFTDSDVYKYLEAMAWDLGGHGDGEGESRFDAISRAIVSAQEPDGYLNTFYGQQGKEARYQDLSHGHELYCLGHLFQAAVARLRTRGEDELTEVARRAADRVCEDFGPGANGGVCGHPEVELGLVELYRATGERRYLDQARLFIERRGHRTLEPHPIGWEYYQDDVPIREATVFRGHVVRSQYLAAAATDVAVETADRELLDAIIAQWDASAARRTYITGGLGARHLGESFGNDYELPPDRAYTETCGAVGSIMVAWRLLLATGESRFADAIERTLYNMVATSLSVDGQRFFYVNPLLQRQPGIPVGDDEVPFRKDTLRAPWFWVSCCPTNVSRLLGSLAAYVATVRPAGLDIHQYATGTISGRLEDGAPIRVSIETDYPWTGVVDIRVVEPADRAWELAVRVPAWAGEGATLEVTGDERPAQPGYARAFRTWHRGDRVRLRLPLEPRFTWPDPRIDALRGSVAVERGPLVYCLESADFADADWRLEELSIKSGSQLAETAGPLADDVVAVTASGVRSRLASPSPWPFGPKGAEPEVEPVQLRLVPYYLWSNRGPSTMRVWIPVSDGA
jgi:DUF1680 family protein